MSQAGEEISLWVFLPPSTPRLKLPLEPGGGGQSLQTFARDPLSPLEEGWLQQKEMMEKPETFERLHSSLANQLRKQRRLVQEELWLWAGGEEQSSWTGGAERSVGKLGARGVTSEWADRLEGELKD